MIWLRQGYFFTKYTCTAHIFPPSESLHTQTLMGDAKCYLQVWWVKHAVRLHVFKICNHLVEFIHFYSFIHLLIKHKSQLKVSIRTCENSNLWKTLTHIRYKHAAGTVCCQSFMQNSIQNCQADEIKSAALSNSGVSQWLKLTCRPTEHFSPEYKIVTK